MIYELRTYTVKQGTAPEMAKTAGTVGRDIRGDNYGKLEGYWVSEIGHLNQLMHLWSYSDLNERARLRGELGKNKRWTSEYIPLTRQNLIRQEVRLLNAVVAPKAPATTPNVYELRAYRCKPGMSRPWADLIAGVLPVREKYSKIVGLWVTEAGQPNEAVHIWAYPDLNARAAARAGAMKDPGWQEFLGKSAPYLEELNSTIMMPAAHSPLK
jgi:NIPSNAP protein